MVGKNHGWAGIVRNLNSDLERAGSSLIDSAENDYGLPVFRYSTADLTEQQAALAAGIVERAEKVAQETCAWCGDYGTLSYSVDEGRSRVYCTQHRPAHWSTL